MVQEKLYKTSICYKYHDDIDGTDNEDEFVIDDCPSDDESDDVMVASPSLGAMMISIWNKRKEKLIDDYAISGWFLCPIKVVFDDACANHNGED